MQINKYYQSFFIHSVLICLFVYLFIGLFSTKAFAEGFSLSVSPSILQIEAIPPADARAPLTVENLSDETVKLKIGYKLFRASDKRDGQIEFLKDSDPFPGADKNIFEKIELIDGNFSIDSLELGPKQKKKLELRVIAPKKEPHSDYYFSLIFLAEPQTVSTDEDDSGSDDGKASGSSATGGIAVNVLLSIGPKKEVKGYIEKFSTPFWRESGPVFFELLVKNAGSRFITPKGSILIHNMFGQTVGKIDISPDNVLAGTSRYLTEINYEPPPSPNSPHTPTIKWPDTFLLGFYTADLQLAMSEQGPVYTRTIHFIAFPVKLFLGILIAVLIIILAWIRVKKKMKD